MGAERGAPRARRSGGLTLQIQVEDPSGGLAFYSRLFGRGPDFSPHDDFFEWRVVDGAEVWWQITPSAEPTPLRTRTRVRVEDVRAAALWAMEELDVDVSEVSTLPAVVSFVDFEDPWHNRLGFYEHLAPSGAQPVVGGSVRDRALFVSEPVVAPTATETGLRAVDRPGEGEPTSPS